MNRHEKFEKIFTEILRDENFEWLYVRILKFWQQVPHNSQNNEISWNIFRDLSHVMVIFFIILYKFYDIFPIFL